MPRERCLQHCSRWKTCIIDRLCCRQKAMQDHPVSTPADPHPPGGNSNAMSAQSPQITKVEISPISMGDLDKLLNDVTEICERLQRKVDPSSIRSRLSSQWDKYRETGISLMETVDSLPEVFANEVTSVGKSLLLPLLKKVLGEIGGLHWLTVGFSFIAWSLSMMETDATNWDGCLKLLKRTILLLKNTKEIWESTSKENVDDLEDSVDKAFQCAVICSSIMNRYSLFRFLTASTIEDSIANLDKDLDSALRRISDFAGREVHADRQRKLRQVTLPSNQEMVVGDGAKETAMACLHSDRCEIVAVCLHGMGGVGKSTMGNSIFAEFQRIKSAPRTYRCCRVEFPFNSGDQDVLNIQKEIVDKLCSHGPPDFRNTTDGKELLKRALKNIRDPVFRDPVFLYLDNVLNESHLSKLLPEASCFPKYSRILVTTRYECVRRGIHSLDIAEKDVKLIEVKKLDERLAKELLLKQLQGNHGPEKLEMELLRLCDGLPLALTLVGGYINDQGPSDAKIWETAIEAMSKAECLDGEAEDKLYSRLKFSLNDLDRATRKVFLDVVAFAVGWPWEDAERLVNRRHLEILQKRALLERREDLDHRTKTVVNTVGVHDVLLKMGLQLVEADAEVIRVLSQDALDNIRSPSALEKVVGLKNVTVEGRRFQQMPCLRVLQKVEIEGECQAAKLRHLSVVDMTSATSWPFDIGACTALKQLTWAGAGGDKRELDLKLLKCEQLEVLSISEWSTMLNIDSISRLCSLKVVNFHRCDNLKSVPEGVASWRGLTSFVLSQCGSLESLPEEVASWTGLTSLDLSGCGSLQSLPEGVARWMGLTSLSLSGCGRLQALPEGVESWTGLTSLDLQGCGRLRALPEGVASWTALKSLDLQMCGRLQALPEGVARWTGLTSLDLSGCESLQSLPKGVASWTGLTSLGLSVCESLQSLPEGVGNWTGLTSLDLLRCFKLRSLPEGVASWTGLTSLGLSKCLSLQALPKGVASWTALRILDIYGCERLQALPEGVASWTGLTYFVLSQCQCIKVLPEGVGGWTSLVTLDLSGCDSLQALPKGVAKWTSLASLDLSGCARLQSLPEEVASWTSLSSLDLSGCLSLQAVPKGVASWTGLTSLDLSCCGSFQSLPEEVASWTSLKSLDLYECGSLQSLPEGVASWTGLTSLNLSGCGSLLSQPNGVASWTSLTSLYLSGELLPEGTVAICPPELANLTCLKMVGVCRLCDVRSR